MGPGMGPGWGMPPGVGPGWGRGWGPGWTLPSRATDMSRLLPTLLVGAVIAAIVLGGLMADAAIAAPSAGTLAVDGAVTITAAGGWVAAKSDDATFSGVELRKADAILTAEVVASNYTGTAESVLGEQRFSLDAEAAQIGYGDERVSAMSGYDAASVAFEATVSSGSRTGVIDGELVSMVVDGNAVVILAAAGQGDLDPVMDDVTAMLDSIRPAGSGSPAQ